MQRKILITGSTGFVGYHLIEYLLSKKKDCEIYGTYLDESSLNSFIGYKDKVNFLKGDLTDNNIVKDIVSRIKPDTVYHLAAFAATSKSFNLPIEVIMNNVSVQVSLLEAVRKSKLFDTKILVVSSGDIYGKVLEKDLPVNEDTKLNPANPYSVSKITQDYLGLQYFITYGLKIIRARPFNHIGPGQSPNFVVSAFSKKIAEIEKGKRDPVLPVGNLNSRRDFTNVKDIVRAYDLLIDKGQEGEVYNIGSGKSYKIGDILDMLLSFSKEKIKVEIDEKLLRPVDEHNLYCDYSKLNKLTGWEPTISIEDTLRQTLDYWRNII